LPPEAIAQAAITHGRDDDITVISVCFGAPARPVEDSSLVVTTPI
jgi:hypothetical protein